MKEQVFDIGPDGSILTIYADDLLELGENKISRASIVEPAEDGSGWYVKLSDSPLNREHAGKLIGTGFKTRQEALDFEVQWISLNILAK